MAKTKPRLRALLLAAGKGTRMRSRLPKVLHPLAGQPMVLHALAAARAAGDEQPTLVIGYEAEQIRAAVGDQADYVEQNEQLGTGHAVAQAREALQDSADLVLVSSADMPLLEAETLQRLVATQSGHDGPFTMLTVSQDDPRGFGRVLRSVPGGPVQAIIEEAEATPDQMAITELNVGAYCFRAEWLWQALDKLSPSAKKGEYYLTDLVAIAVDAGEKVAALAVEDAEQAIGVNTREHLAQAEAAIRRRILRAHMLAGVTIVDPASSYIDAGVRIGQDTVIRPNTHIEGDTVIGADNVIGPNCVIRDSQIGDHCVLDGSYIEGARIENNVDVGPFSHLRKGAHLQDHVHIGNYAELKNSVMGPGSKMGHNSYLGDTIVGANVNIGAGTITANYDGTNKHKTEIGEGAFIGVDSMLVAPLKIGKGARTGAGAVVTKDVPAYTLVVGIPSRAIRKLEEHD
jgi:bifunctional UDP-N-acetylglucosamine pyrophosphorylase/glucosamine-1-phosphate N-acetyltransferase